MNSESKEKVIFAKPTAHELIAIVAYRDGDILKVCEIMESESLSDFLISLVDLAKKHVPWIVNYECSVYTQEGAVLRRQLAGDNIKVRCYKSESRIVDKIMSQADWISNHVLIEEKYSDFVDRMTSFNPSDDRDRNNIAMDVLSDATIFFRRYYFK